MHKNLDTFIKVTEDVYGKLENLSQWTPKPYKENKSRYLWTDAYGVCNFITLFYETGQDKYLEAADRLIQNVHDVLGKDREGKKRLGNATDQEPLKGGLRIGKVEPEGAHDGDGQYFHYLTKWMFALNRMSLARKDPKYNNWAIQMAQSVHPHFVYNRMTQPRMYWKISIDMSQPWVRSEGNLDPYDGLITYKILQEHSPDKSVLASEISDMNKMVQQKYKYYNSNDPLDLGEAMWISHWYPEEEWSKLLAKRSFEALEELWEQGEFHLSDRFRLAFREFGTTLGVQCNPIARDVWKPRVEELHNHWFKNLYQRDRDITPVMFCTSLIPGVCMKDYAHIANK